MHSKRNILEAKYKSGKSYIANTNKWLSIEILIFLLISELTNQWPNILSLYSLSKLLVSRFLLINIDTKLYFQSPISKRININSFVALESEYDQLSVVAKIMMKWSMKLNIYVKVCRTKTILYLIRLKTLLTLQTIQSTQSRRDKNKLVKRQQRLLKQKVKDQELR